MVGNKYITFAIPLEPQNSFGIKVRPLYSTVKDFGLHKGEFHSFINFLWYGKQLPAHSLWKRIKAFFMRTSLPDLQVEKHICVKDCTPKMEKKILSFEGVEKIVTPDWYKEKRFWGK